MKTTLTLTLTLLALLALPLSAATVTGRSAKTSLAGTEEIPINDGGTDKKVTVANLLLTAQGAMTATSFNGLTIDTTTGTLDMTNGKTLAVTNTLTLAGTDGTTMTFPSVSGTVVTLAGTQTLTNKTLTSPTMTAPTLGVATATSLNGLTITSSTGTLTVTNGKTLAASNSLTLAGTDGTTMTFPSSTDTVVTLTATQTLTNKLLTAPKLADLGFIADANGNELVIGDTVASAVNEVTIVNAATGNAPRIKSSGETNVPLLLTGKGTGKVQIGDAADATKLLTFELVNATTAKTLTLNSVHTDNRTVTFADSAGTVMLSSLATNAPDAANSITGASNALTFEGATANAHEIVITPADATADVVYLLPDAAAASYALVSSTLATNAPDIANSVTGTSGGLFFEGSTADASEIKLVAADATADAIYTLPAAAAATYSLMSSTLATNAPDIANSVTGASAALVFEGTADAHETSLTATDATADRTVTIPNATGTVSLSQASTTTALTADNQAVTPGSNSRLQLTSDNATAGNRTFTLSATGAISGQIYVLIGPATNACEIADTGIQKLSAAWSPGATDTLTLLFDGTNFIELARADN